MTSIANFEYILTKVRARRARIYEGDAFDRLLVARDLSELAAALGIEHTGTTHFILEAALVKRHVEEIQLVTSHLDGAKRRLFDRLLYHYVKENLKVIVRLWANRHTDAEAQAMVADLPEQLALDTARFFSAGSMAELVTLIHDPLVRTAVEKCLGTYEETGTTFFIELAIDAGHFRGLDDACARLGRAHRRGAQQLIHSELTAHDVLTALRARFNYGIPLDRIRPFLVQPRKLGLDKLEIAGGLADAQALSALLVGPKAAAALKTIPELERATWSKIHRLAVTQFRESVADLGALVAFCYLKRVELANLVSLVEGIRLDLNRDENRANLLPVGGG